MSDKKGFWYAQMLALLALYAGAALLALNGQGTHTVVRIALIVLGAHVLEVPLAFYMLKARKPQALRLIAATLLFGGLWWVPARRGLFAVA